MGQAQSPIHQSQRTLRKSGHKMLPGIVKELSAVMALPLESHDSAIAADRGRGPGEVLDPSLRPAAHVHSSPIVFKILVYAHRTE
jgi:hypothetical protein